MSYSKRKKLYQSVEKIRNRPLITYVTSIRPNLSGQMASDAIAQIIQQVQAIPATVNEIDFLIISNGGDPITALRIMEILRERFKHITVLLPYVAYSAATVLSLGADEIVMHPFSNLGPVDPQLTVAKPNENGVPATVRFSSEDIRNFIDFIRQDVGISDQQHLIASITPLLSEVGSLSIGSAKRGQQLSLTLSEKMLCTHMDDKNKAKAIARTLNSSYYHHGYAVNRKEAAAIGLNIVNPPQQLEALLWEIWQDFSQEMKCESAFDPIKELMTNPTTYQQISQIPVINMPANTTPAFAQQLINAAAQQSQVTQQKSIQLKELIASIESVRTQKSLSVTIDILYWRNIDMSLGVNCTSSSQDWI